MFQRSLVKWPGLIETVNLLSTVGRDGAGARTNASLSLSSFSFSLALSFAHSISCFLSLQLVCLFSVAVQYNKVMEFEY